MHKRPQYSVYDLLIFVITVALIVCGYLFISHRMNSPSNDRRQIGTGVADEARPTLGQTDVVKKLNRWANARYPQLRKRLKQRILRLKNSLVGDA